MGHPSAQNNLALAWFADGQVRQALAVAEANWQAHPNNLFALGDVVRWRCWVKGVQAVAGLQAPLQHTMPLRAEDAIAQVLGLRFLGDEAAAAQAWARADLADFWTHSAYDQRITFQDLQDPEAEWPGSTAAWFPRRWFDTYRHGLAAHQHVNSALVAQHDQAFAAVCDAHIDYLVRVIQRGDEIGRHLAFSVLMKQAQHQHETVRDALLALLKSPTGPDPMRMVVQRWMSEEGLLSQLESVDMWLDGGVQSMRTRGWEISGEPQPSPFPPEGTELNARALTAMHARRFTQAVDLFTQLHHMHPDKPSPLINLAAVKEVLKHSPDDIKALYQQAHALDPDYLFARCGLARCLAKEGQLEQAEALLEPLAQRTQFHCSEARVFLSTQREFALVRGDPARATQLTKLLDDLQETYWGDEKG